MMHVQGSGVKQRSPRKKRSFFELDLSPTKKGKDSEQSVSEFDAISEGHDDHEQDEAEEPRLLDV
jgi:hypothetical protein